MKPDMIRNLLVLNWRKTRPAQKYYVPLFVLAGIVGCFVSPEISVLAYMFLAIAFSKESYAFDEKWALHYLY